MGCGTRPRRSNKRSSKELMRLTQPSRTEAGLMSPSLNQTDATHHHIFEVMQYWNEHIAPENFPAQLPGQRMKYDPKMYIGVASILQHLLIVSLRSIQIEQSGSDPLQDLTVCQYRGRALHGLQQLFADADPTSTALALSAALLAFITDFSLSQSQAWQYHLSAIREMLRCRGGFGNCFRQFPGLRDMLVTFMSLDVVVLTFGQSTVFTQTAIDMQAEYILLLPDLELEMLKMGDLCPLVLLQAVIRTTALRAGYSRSPASWHEAANVLSTIHDFDPDTWANTVASLGAARPIPPAAVVSDRTISAWSSLAQCYKSATLLYVFLPAPLGLGIGDVVQIQEASSTLMDGIHFLFSLADSGKDVPVQAQLWKFVHWPILMSVSAASAANTSPNDVQTNLSRLATLARVTGIRSWLDLAMKRVSLQQAQRSRVDTPTQTSKPLDRQLSISA